MTAADSTVRSDTEILEQDRVTISLVPVVSSQIAAVGYDAATGELVIRFRAANRNQPAIYSYEGVPSEVAAGLIAAASPGTYFYRHIRHGGFSYHRHPSRLGPTAEPSAKEAPR